MGRRKHALRPKEKKINVVLMKDAVGQWLPMNQKLKWVANAPNADALSGFPIGTK